MINKPLHAISKSDLESLLADKVLEQKTIEYKLKLPLPTEDNNKANVLAEITAFANTVGGDLLFGVETTDGIPTRLVGLPKSTIDGEKLRLESSMASGINPKITNYEFHDVDIGDDKNVLILRVNKSWTNPHMVTSNGNFKFYGRSTSGKYPLDVSEIRRSILLSEMAPNHARNFREERTSRIAANDSYVKLKPNVGNFVVHVIPLQSISSDFALNLARLSSSNEQLHQWGRQSFSYSKINMDGILLHSFSQQEHDHYLQWFRNGIVEYCFCIDGESNGVKFVYGIEFENEVINLIEAYFSKMLGLNLDYPVYVFLSMLGANGYKIAFGRTLSPSIMTYGYNVLAPEKEFGGPALNVAKEMKPTFDIIWNAFNFRESPSYDANGHRNPQPRF